MQNNHYTLRKQLHIVVSLIWVIEILLKPVSVHAQTGVVAGDYLQPGEHMVTLERPLLVDGRLYEIHYFTSGEYRDNRPNFIWIASENFLQRNRIQALLVSEDGFVVSDEAIMRRVLILYMAAFEAYERRAPSYLGYIDDTFIDDFRAITRNPVFIEQHVKSIFKSPEEEIAEAMRGMITSQVELPDDVNAFADNVRSKAERAERLEEAINQVIDAARFSNNKRVREIGKDAISIFKNWQRSSEQGRSFVDFGGRRIELFNALNILSLSIRMIWLADLQRERAQWLDDYAMTGMREGILDEQQVTALAIVKAEAEDQWIQRASIVLGFARDTAVDLGVRLTEQAIIDEWVKWSWNQFGKRITGHLVAGAATAFFVGFTLGNILYGLDDLYNNFKAGERADELRRKFRIARLALEERAQNQTTPHFDGELAERYRLAYMLESLAAAQMFRSYSDGVEATVRQGLLSLINPVAWFEGKKWRDAVIELRKIGTNVEQKAEKDLGHPPFIDAAVALAEQRLALGSTTGSMIVDTHASRFSRFGPEEYWHTAMGGFSDSFIWTYCDANKAVNRGRWIAPNLRAGTYQVQAFVPPFVADVPRSYTQAAHYTISHAGTVSYVTRSQLVYEANWLDLGTYFFSGDGSEHVELVDQTGEASGSAVVAFDTVRWIPGVPLTEIWNATPSGKTVYDVVIVDETAMLNLSMKNTGQTPWVKDEVALTAVGSLPSGAPRTLMVDAVTTPGETATWDIIFTASGVPGIRRLSYRMQHKGEPFGVTLTAYVVVLPEQLRDIEQRIRNQIDEWQRQGEQAAEEMMQRIWEEVQKEIERQATNFLEALFAQCFGPAALLSLALVVGFSRSRHR